MFQAHAEAAAKHVLVQAVIEDGPLTYRLACELVE
jgi:hypothetical protein